MCNGIGAIRENPLYNINLQKILEKACNISNNVLRLQKIRIFDVMIKKGCAYECSIVR